MALLSGRNIPDSVFNRNFRLTGFGSSTCIHTVCLFALAQSPNLFFFVSPFLWLQLLSKYILMIIERWVLLPFFTKTDFKDRGAIGPLNGKKGQNGPFCGHNHMRWCGFEIAECVNHFVAFFSPENRRVPSRSNFAPCCGTRSGWPRLPTARILHLWPFCPKTVRGL